MALTTLGSQVPETAQTSSCASRTFSCCGASIRPNLVLLTLAFILGRGGGREKKKTNHKFM